jgi:hypothetical protein
VKNKVMWGRRRGNVQAGQYPGAGPFNYLPPWQRPGWLYGRGSFAYMRYYGAPAPINYNPQSYAPQFTQSQFFQQPPLPLNQRAPYSFTHAPPQLNYLQQPQQLQTHANCIYFNNGTCTLTGMQVPANGAACQNFTPKI